MTGATAHVASECERFFRASLDALLNDTTLDLPWRLADALVDHRWRVDGAGLSLCFANPERARLLADLTPVLLAHLDTRTKETRYAPTP